MAATQTQTQPQPMVVDVTYKVGVDADVRVAMVVHLVQQLLFLRGQIPCVYGDLAAMVEERREQAQFQRKRLVHGSVKKAGALVNAMTVLLTESLPPLFARQVQTVYLVFGATLASPKEVIQVEFHEHQDATGQVAVSPMDPSRLQLLCVQKLLRIVIAHGAQHFNGSLPVTCLHVVASAIKSDEPIPAFSPQQNLRIRFPRPKARRSRVHVIRIHDNFVVDSDGATTANESAPNPFVLYRFTHKLVGKMMNSPSSSSFASLEERVAHLAWRKLCNERQIQGTLRLSKQLQDRDQFIRVAKHNGGKEKKEWMQRVIEDELKKPLPVTTQYYQELAAAQIQDEEARQALSNRHMEQIKHIQAKLDEREAQVLRKKEYLRKRQEFMRSISSTPDILTLPDVEYVDD
ncbi:TPA: hypothetical protein N0F65_009799 [Lagenidium giganteum]|uniref:Uncharacterized protein n=1 Tax=Lagenidium giganteum TaxID=4803 RepID=A0AAV2YKF7_9STRA|nr:TPA: hypothetical protein N0F65_009799 [Lagenidium giganteum]